ncbi:diacylglycerol kinase family lipid kinase [Petrimonas sulfuriphila]|jgi:YegS/Rv2252/BmrU family lipid kinase|uniref:diacylglycerol/lipid kinase family protein n=1 Tax=Petrimonas sulfuriphila TaxID=285070 RepID=UPI003246849A
MEKSSVCVIINPVSGTESKKNIPEEVASAFDQTQFDVVIRITGYPGHATEIAKQAVKNKFAYVLTAGGDGTVNEVAKALVNTDTVLGIIPFGSGNGLARDLRISMDSEKAIQTILDGNVRTIDYGSANGHIFFCTCGVGFDAFISDKFAEEKKRGPLGYVRNIVEGVIEFRSEEYEITHDGGTLNERAFLLTCANASQYGNEVYIAPGADMEDGKMNVSILKPLNPNEIPQTTLQLFTRNIDKNSKMISLLTSSLTIKRKKSGVLHVDGEPVSTGKEIEVKIFHKGLKVFAPKQVEEKPPKEKENIFTAITRWINV